MISLAYNDSTGWRRAGNLRGPRQKQLFPPRPAECSRCARVDCHQRRREDVRDQEGTKERLRKLAVIPPFTCNIVSSCFHGPSCRRMTQFGSRSPFQSLFSTRNERPDNSCFILLTCSVAKASILDISYLIYPISSPFGETLCRTWWNGPVRQHLLLPFCINTYTVFIDWLSLSQVKSQFPSFVCIMSAWSIDGWRWV